jgi:Fe-S-cluster containining protein
VEVAVPGDRELIQIMDAAWADAARRAGPHLACRLGCTQCCHGAFAINALDTARLRAGMEDLRTTDPLRAATVERRARAWIAEWAPDFPGNAASGLLGISEAEQEAFEEFANEAACPALDPATGRCDVYTWRPMTCRVFGPPVRVETGALACCELCFTTASNEEIAACEMTAPHDPEAQLVEEMGDASQTVVAYALVKPSAAAGR